MRQQAATGTGVTFHNKAYATTGWQNDDHIWAIDQTSKTCSKNHTCFGFRENFDHTTKAQLQIFEQLTETPKTRAVSCLRLPVSSIAKHTVYRSCGLKYNCCIHYDFYNLLHPRKVGVLMVTWPADPRAFSSPSKYDKRPWGRGCQMPFISSLQLPLCSEILPHIYVSHSFYKVTTHDFWLSLIACSILRFQTHFHVFTNFANLCISTNPSRIIKWFCESFYS